LSFPTILLNGYKEFNGKKSFSREKLFKCMLSEKPMAEDWLAPKLRGSIIVRWKINKTLCDIANDETKSEINWVTLLLP
jgi:hypothetical protein